MLVEVTSFFDGSNAGVGGKEDAEWVNLQPQDFFDQLASKAWTEQHSRNHHIKQILNAGHALVAINKGFFNGGISLSADGFVYSYLGGGVVSHIAVPFRSFQFATRFCFLALGQARFEFA